MKHCQSLISHTRFLYHMIIVYGWPALPLKWYSNHYNGFCHLNIYVFLIIMCDKIAQNIGMLV